MSDTPKWQRAKIIDPRATFGPMEFRRGTLHWVACEEPTPLGPFVTENNRRGDFSDQLTVRTSRPYNGHTVRFPAESVELLPEFSFADDPDAEVRQ